MSKKFRLELTPFYVVIGMFVVLLITQLIGHYSDTSFDPFHILRLSNMIYEGLYFSVTMIADILPEIFLTWSYAFLGYAFFEACRIIFNEILHYWGILYKIIKENENNE
jgi:hypothetical protein